MILGRRDIILFLLLIIFIAFAPRAEAGRLSDLKNQVRSTASSIVELEKDISKYRVQLNKIGREKRTLEGAIYELDISRSKVQTDLNVTEKRIDNTELTIEILGLEIQEKEAKIDLNTDTVAQTIRRINEADSQTLVESVLGYENLSDFWDEADSLQQFQSALTVDLAELIELKKNLESNRVDLQVERQNLGAFRSDLFGQRSAIDANINEKDVLLDTTKNQESNYQALLNEKLKRKVAFEEELRAIEEQIRIEIDPDSIPSSGSGILAWPVDNVVITQYFGNTSFSTANPQVYSGAGHNGIDLGVSQGSKVKSALVGTVVATGDTDLVCRNASYGKWVLVRHNNGLSTLYAHLSVISVSKGQGVRSSQTLGFSGNTGFSTGPHLHFTVFASEGVQVGNLRSRACGTTYTIPLADRSAYLNPLSYL